MKLLTTLFTLLLSMALINTQAQTGIPEGYSKGSIVLADGSHLTGYIKDNIRHDAAIGFYNEADKKKKEYEGTELSAVQLGNDKFTCIGGDFFKVVSEGELCFLQKASNSAGKVSYNGLENIVSAGTEGKPGDYFICNSSTKELKKVSKKNINEVALVSFAGCPAAIDKARAVNGDVAMVKDAVDIYNMRNSK